MIYAAFTMWLILTVFAGIGVYRMWSSLGKPAQVNWALLPGTLVSQMAYIFGCLITGGEIKNAKMMPAKGDAGGGAPNTSDTPKLKVIGPVVSSLLVLVACAAATLAVHKALGKPVMDRFSGGTSSGYSFLATTTAKTELPRDLPRSWEDGWKLAGEQLQLVKHTCETWWDLDWKNWRVALFVYLSICLAVRLGPGFAKAEFVACLGLAGVVPVVLWARYDAPAGILLATVMTVVGIPATGAVLRAGPGSRLLGALGGTGRLLALYGIAFFVGYLL